ncbi:MAG TPA: glycoside hydrolase family 38 C-terminal domain-containing protein [Armatimonadota bacterium]
MNPAIALIAAVSLGGNQANCAPKPPPPFKSTDLAKGKTAYDIGYAHLDTQWRWTYQETIGRYLPDTMSVNFGFFEKYPDYVFNFTGANRYRMMKEYYPADYAKLKQYVAKGRWYVNGSTWEENDVNTPSPESIIRQLLLGNHFIRDEFGYTPIDFILPDCFGFPASLPSILVHCGVKGFSTGKLSWGSSVDIPFTVGNWIGVDGKSIVSALSPGQYNSSVSEDLSQSQTLLNRIDKVGSQSGAYVDYRYYGTGDRGGGPTEDSVKWIEKSVKGSGPVHLISGPADQMFRDLTPGQVSKLPRYKGDLELVNHTAGSLTSQAYMKRWNRKNEQLADSAERASVAADWIGGMPYPKKELWEAWALILGAQFHDIIPGTSVPKAYEYSWNDEIVALNHSASALQGAVGAVARGLDTRAAGSPVVVYNPLSIVREDVVNATIPFAKGPPESVRVFGPNGKEVPSQIAKRSARSLEVLFLAKAPPIGFVTYDVRRSNAPCALSTGLKVGRRTLENARYRVVINPDGDVSKIYDKTARRELLSAPARLEFRFDEPVRNPAWDMNWEQQKAPALGYVSGPATVRVVENGPVRVTLEVIRRSRGSTFIQHIRLGAAGAGNRVEFDNEVNWNTMRCNLKATFPMAVSNQNATYNLGVGTIQRPTNTPAMFEMVHQQWIDLTDTRGQYGVSVLEDSKYASDKPDDHTIRLTLLRTPGALSYQDQSTQDLGHHEFLYALQGHAGGWRNGNTQWEAARLNRPLIAFLTPRHAGGLRKSFSLFHTNSDRVAIHALKMAEDNRETIVRLQELNGAPTTVTLSAAAPIVSAREVDGEERTIGKATLRTGGLVVKLGEYSPRAFALTLGKPVVRLPAPISWPVPLPYNLSTSTAAGQTVTGGFDGEGHTIAAELLPGSVVSEGVQFNLRPTGKNAVVCDGQRIRLPGSVSGSVYILAAAKGGDQNGTFALDGRPRAVRVQDWSGFVGQWYNRMWNQSDAPNAPLLPGGIYGLRPAYIKRDPIAWLGRHRHTADGKNDIYAYSYIFRYRLPAVGAKTLTLPRNANIRVFAVTVADNPNDYTDAAQYLYDHFNRPAAARG